MRAAGGGPCPRARTEWAGGVGWGRGVREAWWCRGAGGGGSRSAHGRDQASAGVRSSCWGIGRKGLALAAGASPWAPAGMAPAMPFPREQSLHWGSKASRRAAVWTLPRASAEDRLPFCNTRRQAEPGRSRTAPTDRRTWPAPHSGNSSGRDCHHGGLGGAAPAGQSPVVESMGWRCGPLSFRERSRVVGRLGGPTRWDPGWQEHRVPSKALAGGMGTRGWPPRPGPWAQVARAFMGRCP